MGPGSLAWGGKLERRVIQLGIPGSTLREYGQREIVEIIDMKNSLPNSISMWAHGKAACSHPSKRSICLRTLLFPSDWV